MRRLLIFIGVLLTVQSAYGQQQKIDSLKYIYLNTDTKVEKIESLKDLCLEYSRSSNLEESQPYYNELIEISKELNDDETLSYAYQLLIREYEKKRDSVQALKYFNKSLTLNNASKNYLGLAKDYSALGSLYNKFQEFDMALIAYKKAIDICNTHKITDYIGTVYNNMGIVYQNKMEFTKSMEIIIKANEIATKNSDTQLQASTLNTIGSNYMRLGESEQADKYLKEGLEIALKTSYKSEIINAYRGLGLNASRSGRFEEALNYNFEALKLNNEYGDKLQTLDILLNIATTYSRMNKLKEALNYYDKASIIASELESKVGLNNIDLNVSYIYVREEKYDKAEKLLLKLLNDTTNVEVFSEILERSSYILLSMIYEAKKDYPKSLEYHKKYFRIAYDILSESQIEAATEIETKYQNEKKEKENLQLKTEKAEQEKLLALQTKRNWQLGGGLATTVVGLGIFFIAFRKNQKQKKEIESQKNKVEHLQKELHHRLKNNLAFIDVFISLAKGKYTDSAYRERLNELQNRIKSMFEIHEQLFRKEDITSVNAQKYISKLAENVKAAYANPNISVEQHIDPAAELDSQTSFPMGIIINEFITNSYKYAFTPNQQGIIKIELNGSPEFYKLTLSDNGKGLPESFDVNNSNTFGLDSIKLLTQEYNGTFSLKGDEGVTLQVTLPKPTTL
ncbi:tetratricopeptide repeat protein [uncultured Planktosalinus sp.]|uniref:tetratricopeptide repeat-containing sensor histidine kinase n=1 Tax=uncultured Planktosalinus sp. TaxID=1810935 RepID=UPI0030D84A4A